MREFRLYFYLLFILGMRVINNIDIGGFAFFLNVYRLLGAINLIGFHRWVSMAQVTDKE